MKRHFFLLPVLLVLDGLYYSSDGASSCSYRRALPGVSGDRTNGCTCSRTAGCTE